VVSAAAARAAAPLCVRFTACRMFRVCGCLTCCAQEPDLVGLAAHLVQRNRTNGGNPRMYAPERRRIAALYNVTEKQVTDR
jgi:hypothetical protein